MDLRVEYQTLLMGTFFNRVRLCSDQNSPEKHFSLLGLKLHRREKKHRALRTPSFGLHRIIIMYYAE